MFSQDRLDHRHVFAQVADVFREPRSDRVKLGRRGNGSPDDCEIRGPVPARTKCARGRHAFFHSAVDHFRELGKVRGYIAKDINLIIDCEPGEAETLIEGTEILFEYWFAAKHESMRKLKNLEVMIGKKKAMTEKAELPSPGDLLAAATSIRR